MQDPWLGRFFTIDRFAEKYYDFTPYQYGANSPINFIDINGDSLWIQINKNNKALYVDGNLYNRDGTEYTGKGTKVDKNGNRKLKGFLKTTVANLDQASSKKEGNALVDGLQDSKEHFTIVKGYGGNSYDPKTNEITFDPSSTTGGLNTSGSTSRPTFIGLTHEMAHAFDDSRPGPIDLTPVGTTNQAEIFASHKENQIRSEHNLPLRVQYNKGTPIIDSFGNSIYYNTNYNDGYYKLNLQRKPIRNLVPAVTIPPIKKIK